jgi:Aspartyl/Asparaginyl beta-hydroxylase
VAGETVNLEEGKCVVFDDSFVHEAFNDRCSTHRIILKNLYFQYTECSVFMNES